MPALHIEDFCRDCSLVLLQLFKAFPQPTTVFVEDICGPDSADEFGLHSKRHLAGLGAMLWLAEEGYLRYEDTIRQEAIDQAVLTQKSLILLSQPVDPLDEQSADACLADQLESLLKHASSSELARLLLQTLKQ